MFNATAGTAMMMMMINVDPGLGELAPRARGNQPATKGPDFYDSFSIPLKKGFADKEETHR